MTWARMARMGSTLGAVSTAAAPGAFRSPSQGYVGLHVMSPDLAAEQPLSG